jgi:maltooligosyltrehalose trehalohydrolase
VDRQEFERCILDQSERESHAGARALHQDLITLRRTDPVIHVETTRIDGAVIGAEALVIRYFGGHAGDRLLLVNLGCDLDLTPAPEPLLAPPASGDWELLWSSEAPKYGGEGTGPVNADGLWRVPGECAVLLGAPGHLR